MFNLNPYHGKRLKLFTWHIHGSYLYYLLQGEYDIPLNNFITEDYPGLCENFPFGDKVKIGSKQLTQPLTLKNNHEKANSIYQ